MHLHLAADNILLTGAFLLLGGLVASRVATRLRVPGMILFLLAGMAVADDGLGWLHLANSKSTQSVAIMALVVILFYGGLTNPLDEVKRVLAPAAALATIGVAITAGVVGAIAMWFFKLPALEAMLIGAVVASTDAAAVFSVLRDAPIPRRLAALLETESGVNDPMAVLLTIGLLSMWSHHVTPVDWVVFGVRQLVGGLFVGVVLGWLGGQAMIHRDWVDGAIVPLVGLTIASGAFAVSAKLGASGFLAVYVSAIVLGAKAPGYQRPLKAFFGSLAEIGQFGLFFLLGVLVFPSHLGSVAVKSLAIAAALIFVARPLAIAVCLPWFHFKAREMTFASLAGLRGAVPIVLATFPLTVGYPHGVFIFEVTFFVVLLSAAVQGTAIPPAVKWLGLTEVSPVWDPIAAVVPIANLGMTVVEIRLRDESPLVGTTLKDSSPPDDARVITLVRRGSVEMPTGRTVLESGDLLSVAIGERDQSEQHLIDWARGDIAGH